MCYSITSECVSILLGHRSTCAPEFLIQLLCVCVCAEVPCFVHHGSIQKCWISALSSAQNKVLQYNPVLKGLKAL